MKYMLLIYSDPAKEPIPGTEEFGVLMSEYQAFGEDATKAGVFVAGEALLDVSTATTVTAHNGKIQTTDGPFAETKETLGGFYLLDCKDLDEAISFAAKIPSAKFGSIEVRPLMTFD